MPKAVLKALEKTRVANRQIMLKELGASNAPSKPKREKSGGKKRAFSKSDNPQKPKAKKSTSKRKSDDASPRTPKKRQRKD